MQRPEVIRSISVYERENASIAEVSLESVQTAVRDQSVLFAQFGTVKVPVTFDDTPESVEKRFWKAIRCNIEIDRRKGFDRRMFHRDDGRERRNSSHM